MHHTDVLVIGCGITGCTTALELAKQGFKVTLVTTAREARDSASFMAGKGIVYQGYDDSPELLTEDLLRTGQGLCCPRAVEHLVSKGPQAIEELLIQELGVDFERNPEGQLCFSQGSGHTRARILHFRDHTGKVIIDGLLHKLSEFSNVEILTAHTAVDLLTLSEHSAKAADLYKRPAVLGATLLDNKSGELKTVVAKETVLASGGLGELYRHSSNPVQARGDGTAMAARAGVRLANMQFVQFHPTAFYQPNERPVLLTELLRSEGGVLLSSKGERFMERYHEAAEQAPDEILVAAIYLEQLRTQSTHVWLDLRHCNESWIKEHYPNVVDYCQTKGFDLTKQLIPVIPVAHYSCGGIAVDRVGQTSHQRLRAVGEVACTGVHGARRLYGTSLLEGLVWGRSCAEDIGKQLGKFAYYLPPLMETPVGTEEVDTVSIAQDWNLLKETMWHYVGPVRDAGRLRRAERILRDLKDELDQTWLRSRPNPELVGFRNALETGLLLATSAQKDFSKATRTTELAEPQAVGMS